MSDWFIYLTKKNATWEDYLYGKQIMLISLFDHVKILNSNKNTNKRRLTATKNQEKIKIE